MLDFIIDEIASPAKINCNRVFRLNKKPICKGDIVYLASRELRIEDNWAVSFALELAKIYNRKIKIVVIIDEIPHSDVQLKFFRRGLNIFEKNANLNQIDFEIVEAVPQKYGALIVDFNPINLHHKLAVKSNCAVFEVDSHNIVPARYVSMKQEFSAATLRRKIYACIADFLTEYKNYFHLIEAGPQKIINEFISNKLDYYTEFKNDPTKDFTSHLSPYLHFGFIASQRVVLSVINSNASRINKETFLEEIIVRKELSDNFCLHNTNYKTVKAAPDWAKQSLNSHSLDIRTYLYSQNEFEFGKTHDEFWNKIQQDFISTNQMHGYLRMYWAKKILEWSKTPAEALKIAIYLNDKYALDGIDPNGYVGILWSILGVHDRAFANRMVTGKIRYMSLSGCKKKFNVEKYISAK